MAHDLSVRRAPLDFGAYQLDCTMIEESQSPGPTDGPDTQLAQHVNYAADWFA
jgi:hypothetical protein